MDTSSLPSMAQYSEKSLDPRVIVALDYSGAEQALALVSRLKPDLCKLKVGFELYVSAGPDLVRTLVDSGFHVFLDLKFHDIPNTVAAACSSAARLGVWMMNVHASGGMAMMQSARSAVECVVHTPRLIAVTMLTSLCQDDVESLGISTSLESHVIRLARMAQSAGLDGIVCSAREVSRLRQEVGDRFLMVTPGIRTQDTCSDDQKRTLSHTDAIRAGADYLVIGRPVTQAEDPVLILGQINTELSQMATT